MDAKARMKEMLRLRWQKGLSLAEIGRRYGISRQRVLQIIGPTGHLRLSSSQRGAVQEAAPHEGKSP